MEKDGPVDLPFAYLSHNQLRPEKCHFIAVGSEENVENYHDQSTVLFEVCVKMSF